MISLIVIQKFTKNDTKIKLGDTKQKTQLRIQFVQSHLYLFCHEGVFALLQSCYETVPRHLHPLPCQPLPQNLHCHVLWSPLTVLCDVSHLVPESILEQKAPKQSNLWSNS